VNRYATLASNHWRQHLPSRYAQLRDPQAYFIQLGEQVEEQIEALAEALAGTDPAEETYLQKVGRLTEARATAESTVLRELVLLESETDH
jgi:hypothetical protein